MVYIKYLTMYNVHLHAGAIRKLFYGIKHVYTGDNPLAKARGLSSLKPPFHWTAIPLRFEILVKVTRIVTETASAKVVVEVCRNFRFYIERIQKRIESVAPSPRSYIVARSQLHRHQRKLSVARSLLS